MPILRTPSDPPPRFDDVWRMFQESDRRSRKTARLMKERAAETGRMVKALTISIGTLGNRLGDFVEAMVKPGFVRLFQQRGLAVHRTEQNLTRCDDDGQFVAQVDIL